MKKLFLGLSFLFILLIPKTDISMPEFPPPQKTIEVVYPQLLISEDEYIAYDIKYLAPHVEENKAVEYSLILVEELKLYDFEYKDILALIKVESNFRETAVSHKGAVGLMQVMPIYWARRCGSSRSGLRDPRENIRCGLFALNTFSEGSKSFNQTLCRYNGACRHCSSCSYSRKINKERKKL